VVKSGRHILVENPCHKSCKGITEVEDARSAVVAMIVDKLGVRPVATAADLREYMTGAKFFWLDIFGGDAAARNELLGRLSLDAADMAWAVRFGQTGRLYIGRDKLRAVTWMADAQGNLSEIHVLSSPRYVLTVWEGDAAALDEIRQLFGERAEGLEKSHFAAAALLLQLLIGTLAHTMRSFDLSLDKLRMTLDHDPDSADVTALSRRLQILQTITSSFNRYSSAVRSAIVGIESVSGMDEHGAAELNDYADQVEDFEEQLHERRRWMSDIMHDSAMAIAQRQAEQINRLTLVSLIFLPVTALSGFFGMNFNWMISHLGSGESFLVLGILLPIVSVVLSIAWFRHRGLIYFKSRPRREMPPAGPFGFDDPMARQHLKDAGAPEHEASPPRLQSKNP
jgi:Mg2+ and Co2+ transporter CorA